MNNSAINTDTIQLWINAKLSQKAIEETLISNGYEPQTISEYLTEYNRIKRGKKQLTGIVLMGIGGFIGFIACVMALLDLIPGMQDFFLFALTIIGISIVFYGMYLVFQ